MIEVKGLSKTFKSPKKGKGLKGTIKSLFSREYTEVKAVDDISFTIQEGEIIGYIGANGAGKSTTIKMMTGILVPSSGEISVDGRVPYKERQENAQHIGVVFGQKTQLWWDLPLGETFTILKEIYQVPEDEYLERMTYFNEVLSLEDFMDKTVRSLSLGQRMRADLAASMLHNPKVLYLDEPTIGLDVVVKEKLRKAIKDMNKRYKTTIILTTHDMSDIEELCSRLIIIDQGHILYDGDLETIRSQFGNQRQLNLDIREQATDLKATSLIHKTLGVEEQDLLITTEDSQLILKFNGALVKLSEVMNYVLKEFNVLDFSLKETAIEDIVKKLY
jgi:ABC-2 type transport system ATP-binding protein